MSWAPHIISTQSHGISICRPVKKASTKRNEIAQFSPSLVESGLCSVAANLLPHKSTQYRDLQLRNTCAIKARKALDQSVVGSEISVPFSEGQSQSPYPRFRTLPCTKAGCVQRPETIFRTTDATSSNQAIWSAQQCSYAGAKRALASAWAATTPASA